MENGEGGHKNKEKLAGDRLRDIDQISAAGEQAKSLPVLGWWIFYSIASPLVCTSPPRWTRRSIMAGARVFLLGIIFQWRRARCVVTTMELHSYRLKINLGAELSPLLAHG